MRKKLIYLVSFVLLLSIVSSVQADTIIVGSDADTYVGDAGAHGDANSMYLQNTANIMGYLRFDLSGLDIIAIRSATLTLTISGDTPRNDNPVTGRFVLNGLDNIAGNTPQDWDEAVLDVNTVGAEWSTNVGEPLVNVTNMDMNEADPDPAITETIAGSGDYWLPGARTITITGDPLASFIQGRIDDNGLVTFILEFPGGGSGRGYGLATKENANEAFRPMLELVAITGSTPVITWVGEDDDQNGDGVIDDIDWIPWIENQGYLVDFRPEYWTVLDPNKVEELNAADLVIVSRNTDSDAYANGNEPALWNSVTAPMIMMSSYLPRSNRWQWVTHTETPFMDVAWEAVIPDHPVFSGVELDPNNQVLALDASKPSAGTAHLGPDVGNGLVIAMVPGTGEVGIVEWEPGIEYNTGGPIVAGRRLLFTAGTTESGGNPQGMFNLTPAGELMFSNAISYMLPAPPAEPIHAYTFEDGTANDSVGEADGTLVGGAEVIDGAMVTTAQDQWMSMPGDVIAMNTYDEVTIEAWYTPTEGANLGWSMLAYFGGNANGLGSNGFFITSARGDNKSRAAISIGDEASPWASESGADGPEYDDGLDHYMASTIDATDITLYIDGVLIASTPLSATNSIAGISQELALLAKGGYDGDPEWIGAIEEFNIYNVALSAKQIAANYVAGPVQ